MIPQIQMLILSLPSKARAEVEMLLWLPAKRRDAECPFVTSPPTPVELEA